MTDDIPDDVSDEPGPEFLAARTELADLVDDASGGLSDRDRSVLELAYRHGLDGADLAEALGVSQNSANVIVHRLRDTVERSLGALLVSRGVRRDSQRCAELADILDGWDGTFTVLMRKRVARHIDGCTVCDEERRRLVNPVALLGTAPAFIPAPTWLRDRTLREVALTSSARRLPDDHVGETRHTYSAKLPATLFAVALLATLGLTLVWLQQRTTAVMPVDTSQTAPPPPAMPLMPVKSSPSAPPPISAAAPPPPSAVAPPPEVAPQPKQPPPAVHEPTPVVDEPTPVVEEPAPIVDAPPPVAPPPVPPPPPVLPPLQWPEWKLPQWPSPPPPPQPPGAGSLTVPPKLIIEPPLPPAGDALPQP